MNDRIKTKIVELYNKGGNNAELAIEELLEQALERDPCNIDLLLRLALLEFEPPIADSEKCIAVLERVLKQEPNNTNALMLLASVNYFCLAGVDEVLFRQLNSVKTANNELSSTLKYVASWFYREDLDSPAYEQLLTESINLCQSHVYNYVRLAELYLRQNRPAKAKLLMQTALQNIVKIYGDNEAIDFTDIQEFLCERIKGIYLSNVNANHLRTLLTEAILREKLLQNPTNIETLLELAIIEIHSLTFDYNKKIVALTEALSCEPDNVVALLLLAYASRKNIDESFFQKLISLSAAHAETKSMLLYTASWFYKGGDDNKYEELLKQSVAAYPFHVHNYRELALLYSRQGRHDEAIKYACIAIKNIVKTRENFDYIAETALSNNFLNCFIKGIRLSQYELNELKKIVGDEC